MKKIIEWVRTEFHAEKNETMKAPLIYFVYDVPYLSVKNVFPPFVILNSILSSGGGDGGMGPWAIWKPFTIDELEYNELLDQIINTELKEIKKYGRYAKRKIVIDPALDLITDREEWTKAVIAKYNKNP